jgi:hypothetical protein
MLDSNLAAREVTVDADAFAELAEQPDDYWAARSELPWN